LFIPSIIIAILFYLGTGSQVLVMKQRTGLHVKTFYIYKFRTMTDERDNNGNLLSDEYRITRIGYFVRKFSLDELPQLLNVLKGDSRFVGPGPLLMEYLPLYTLE